MIVHSSHLADGKSIIEALEMPKDAHLGRTKKQVARGASKSGVVKTISPMNLVSIGLA